jgi:hypothetical protein
MKVFGILALGVALLSPSSRADIYDFQIYRLGNPNRGGANYDPNANNNFRTFAREFAAGLTSVNLMPPSSLGHSGFAVNTELSVLTFNKDRSGFPLEGGLQNLLVPSVHVQKGLPFSFEVGARLGWIEKSRTAVATAEGKWAINEGFSYLPDVGLRGFITKLINSRDYDLWSTGLDTGLGKSFAIAGTSTLTPYLGWSLVWVAGTSGTVDFNPARSAQEAYRTPASGLQDTGAFADVAFGANAHNRFYGGFRFLLGDFSTCAEFSYSNLGALAPVIAFNSAIGLRF